MSVINRALARFLERLKEASPVGGIVRTLIYPLLKGRQEYFKEYFTTWDDLRAPASGINPPGLVSDPARAEDGSFSFSHNAINLIAIVFQMPHSWKEGSAIEPHIHWYKTTDAAGIPLWEMRYKISKIGELSTAWSSWLPVTHISTDPGSTQRHTISAFAEIDMTDYTLSTMLLIQVRRNATDAADNYEATASFLEFDIHYQLDGLGSFEEYIKGEVEKEYIE